MTSISNIWKQLTSILSNLNNFHSLEVVDRVSETQFQVGENSDWIIWRLKGWGSSCQGEAFCICTFSYAAAYGRVHTLSLSYIKNCFSDSFGVPELILSCINFSQSIDKSPSHGGHLLSSNKDLVTLITSKPLIRHTQYSTYCSINP